MKKIKSFKKVALKLAPYIIFGSTVLILDSISPLNSYSVCIGAILLHILSKAKKYFNEKLQEENK